MSEIGERRDRQIERQRNRKTRQPMPKVFSASVVGTSRVDPDVLRRLHLVFVATDNDPPTELVREPDNEHDPNAISVRWLGEHVGYITRPVAMRLAPELDEGAQWRVRVDGVNIYDDRPVGVTITCFRMEN